MVQAMKINLITKSLMCTLAILIGCASVYGQANRPTVRILLPERTRLLEGQLVDLVIEVRNSAAISGLRVTAGGADITGSFAAPQAAQLDCDESTDLVIRANLQSFSATGSVVLRAEMSAG